MTPEQRALLRRYPETWQRLPRCFTPNDVCRELIDAGWLEIEGEPGTQCMRRTPLGTEVCNTEGSA